MRLAAHVDPILVLFAPFWWVHQRPRDIDRPVYVASLAAGVYPVVRLALVNRVPSCGRGFLGAGYLTLPWVIWIGLNEVNPMSRRCRSLLTRSGSSTRIDSGHSPLAVAAVLTGEPHLGITVAALGVWYALGRRRVRAGIADRRGWSRAGRRPAPR